MMRPTCDRRLRPTEDGARCDCMADGTPAGLRGQIAMRGIIVCIAGATTHLSGACMWRVTASAGDADATFVSADVDAAIRGALAALVRVATGTTP